MEARVAMFVCPINAADRSVWHADMFDPHGAALAVIPGVARTAEIGRRDGRAGTVNQTIATQHILARRISSRAARDGVAGHGQSLFIGALCAG